MNVLLAALSAPAQLNGVSRHAVNLARALLCQPGVRRVHFVAGAWQKEMFRSALADLDSRLHLHCVALPDANWSRLSWYQRDLPPIAAQLEADVVHLTYPAPIASGAFDSPVVLTLHDLYPVDIPENFGALKGAFARWTMRRCIQRVDAIACVSASTQERLARWLPGSAAKSVVIPNVVERIAASARDASLAPLVDRAFVLCVAQHRCNKNVPLTIRIFDRMLRERVLPPTARLLVVGIPGPETNRILAQIRRSRLGGKVLLLAGLSDAELRWCYENCAVLVAPSSIEGFGLPIAEATLAGCRIVCSDIPAFREVGGANCRFVPLHGDAVAAFAGAVQEALAAARPGSAALPHLSPNAVGRQYIGLYENLICSRIPESGMLRQPNPATEPLHPADSHPN